MTNNERGSLLRFKQSSVQLDQLDNPMRIVALDATFKVKKIENQRGIV